MPLRTPEECYAPRLRPYHPCRGEDRPATRIYKHSTPGGLPKGAIHANDQTTELITVT